MSIRQIRLSSTDEIQSRIGAFTGKAIHVILTNSSALFGVLRKADQEGIVLENRRLKENRYPYREIAEVYFDQIV